ncbi:MAG TPA: PxKF domain-containing protein [Steroidobacteraceae bacterium]|nr:PxKF domain-containing protein [Steroidobacteraceae bacterium]
MSNVVSRARVWALLGLLAYAPLVASQTIEIFAGGAHLRDTPGTSVAVSPGASVLGPDGRIYLITAAGKILRFDPAQGAATSLPGVTGKADFRIGFSWGIAFRGANDLYVAGDNALNHIDLAAATMEKLPGLPQETGPMDGMAFRADGTLYYPSVRTNTIRALLPNGQMIVVAGQGGAAGFSGDGGPASNARFSSPRGLALDANGNIYVSDDFNWRIRKIDNTTGIISTVAGGGTSDMTAENLPALQAFMCAQALTLDSAGNIYYFDHCLHKVRQVNVTTGRINTVAGNGVVGYTGDGGPATEAAIGGIAGIVVDAGGNLYLTDQTSNRMRMVSSATGIISTVLGNGTTTYCGDEGLARDVCLGYPEGLAIDSVGDVYIADDGNNRLRKVSAASGTIATLGQFAPIDFGGIDVDAGRNVFWASSVNYSVNRLSGSSGGVSRFAGTGTQGFSGDGGPAFAAQVSGTTDVALDPAGNIFFSDSGNHRIRRVDKATNVITTYAGNGLPTGPLGDGGPAAQASLNNPGALTFDSAGNLYIVDGQHYRVRRVDAISRVITTVAGNGDGSYATTGDGGPATFASIGTKPVIAVDTGGNIYLGWTSKLRRINAATGFINPIPEPAGGLRTPEGQSIQVPVSMVFDRAGRLYVGDAAEQVVFRLSIPAPLPDSTPPTIQPNIVGTEGNNGWYRGNVQLTWTVSDAESAVSSSTGCSASSVTADSAGVTFTCTANSAGGTASSSVTIKRDTAAPTLTFGAASPAADANGWRGAPVSVPFDASDALSGVYSTSSASPLSISEAGSGVTGQVVVTDAAGNSATFTTAGFNIDASPPSISQFTYGTSGMNGWYRSDARVTFSVLDLESEITSREGCDETTVSSDTTGVTFTCTATSAGGTSTHSVTVKRDITPPTLNYGTPSPTPNAAGWNTTDVAFPFTTDDATSGVLITSQPSPAIVPFDGPGVTTQITVSDNAGNSATVFTPPVNIDRVAPIVQGFASGTAGTNGWYKSDVQVTWNVVKAPESILAISGCGASNITADTAGVTFTCSVTSGAGTASSSITIKRDATPPALTFGTPTPAANTNGWNKTNVSIPFTRSDAMSGLASTSATSPLILNTEGAAVTGQAIVTDLAGNAATFTTVARNIDKTVPVVNIVSPANGASYGFYQDVLGDFSCTDVSLLSCIGTTADGDPVNTKTAGARTFKVTGKDLVSFTTAVTNSFTVDSEFNFDGFLAPASAPPTLNLVTRGATVPVRWKLPDGHGGFVSNPASFVSATVASLTCGSSAVVPLNDSSGAPAGISFDSGTFTYNWATSSGWTGCRKLTIKLKDNSLHELRFKFR